MVRPTVRRGGDSVITNDVGSQTQTCVGEDKAVQVGGGKEGGVPRTSEGTAKRARESPKEMREAKRRAEEGRGGEGDGQGKVDVGTQGEGCARQGTVEVSFAEVLGRREKLKRTPKEGGEAGQRSPPAAPSRPVPRLDAIRIRCGDEAKYAGVLTEVMGSVNPTELGVTRRKVRRTRKGEVLLEVGRGVKREGLREMRERIGKIAGDRTTVDILTPRMVVEVLGVPEFVAEPVVLAVIGESLGDPGPRGETEGKGIKVLGKRKLFGGSFLYRLGMGEEEGLRLLALGKHQMAWSICRVRRGERVLRCLKCHHFGHMRDECRSGADRRCLRCGGEGHKVEGCSNAPRCLACADLGVDGCHFAGAVGCRARWGGHLQNALASNAK